MGSRLESNSNAVRKRIEQHTFTDERGDEYEGSNFGGFGEYMRRKKIKLQNLDAERRARNLDKPAIFRGVVVHVNGYTQPSLNDLHKMIVDYGGGFMQYLDGKTSVTHVVAANITPKKREEFKRYRIVKPAWIVDSIKAGKLLHWDDYRVVEDVRSQRTIGFNEGKIVHQTASQGRRTYKEQTDASWYADQVRAKATMVDGGDSGPPSSKASDVYRASVIPQIHPAQDVAQINSAMNDVSMPEIALEENAAAASDSMEDALPDQFDPHASQMEQADVNEVDEHSKKKASYLTEGDLRPDDAGDWQLNGPMPFKNPKTPEEHNANLLADPKKWKSTVVNPAFLKQYYEESRLHHLSTWKAELKSQLQVLAQEQTSSQKARQKRPKGSCRYVLHVDFDSFFAAVSLLKHPDLKEKPVVVAHGGGSASEIASCNYPARKFGIKNGMWMRRAKELCPDLTVLPYDFKAYEDASRKFYEVIMDVGGIVQSVSIDEALVDITMKCIGTGSQSDQDSDKSSIEHEQQKADEIAQTIRDGVMQLTGCAVSVGIGANILQAKLALRKAKPAGQYQLKPDQVLDFIGELTVQDLPGVAYSIGNKLEEIGIKYIKDIRKTTKERLVSTMGPKTGHKLWEYAQGIDRVEVGEQTTRKSVSAEVNWGIRFATQEQAEEFIASLCGELEKRLLNEGVKGRQFCMKIMRRAKDEPLDPPKHLGHGRCDVFNKSNLLGVATNSSATLTKEALSILRGFGFPPGELRGIGVQMTKLELVKGTDRSIESSQRLLPFGALSERSPKRPLSKEFQRSNTPSKSKTVTFADVPDRDSNGLVAPSPTRIPTLVGDDEVETPHKTRVEDKLGLVTPQSIHDVAEDAFLNTSGTQFILPSQADPDVIAALPDDIRSRFARASAVTREKQKRLDLDSTKRSESPDFFGYEDVTQSQLDPETLAALPDDIREEILAQFKHRGSPRSNRQSVLPNSPHTKRSSKVPVKKAVPAGRRGGLLSRGRGHRPAFVSSDAPTLTQANFVFSKSEKEKGGDDDDIASSDEISADVLDELPAEIRAEILERQQKDRLRRKGGLDYSKRRKPAVEPDGMMQQTLEFAPRPPKPTFTSRKLSTLSELREAVSAWFESTRHDEVEMEDVEALSGFLRRVITEEKDMHKAVSVVKWLLWLVDEGGEDSGERWELAVQKLTKEVQAAISQRGLGKVDF